MQSQSDDEKESRRKELLEMASVLGFSVLGFFAGIGLVVVITYFVSQTCGVN